MIFKFPTLILFLSLQTLSFAQDNDPSPLSPTQAISPYPSVKSSVESSVESEPPSTPQESRALVLLENEAAQERVSYLGRFIPLQISSLNLSLASLYQFYAKGEHNKRSSLTSPIVGLSVGMGWLVASTWMSMRYFPYQTGLQNLDSPRKNSDKQAAEATIRQAAQVGRRLELLSSVTEAGASLFLIYQTPAGSKAIFTNVISLASAFLPLIWYSHWFSVENELERMESHSVSISPLILLDSERAATAKLSGSGFQVSFYF